jgi:hypothetical protein
MCGQPHVLHAHGIGLVVWRLGRYAYAQWEITMAMPCGIFIYVNSPQLVELHGTRGGSRAALSQEAGAGAMGHVATPELP